MRAEEEMLNACTWHDWDPGHWLDTAEVMTALSIGYDWMFDYLSQETKDKITDALINKGLCHNAGWSAVFDGTSDNGSG